MCDQLFESEWAFSRRSQAQGPLGQRHWQPLCRDLVNPLSTNRSSYFARYTHTLFCNTHYCLPTDPAIFARYTHTILRDTILSTTRLNYLAKPIHYFARHTHGISRHTHCFVKRFLHLSHHWTQKMLNTTKLHFTSPPTIATLTLSAWVLFKNSWTFPQSTVRDWAVREAFAKSPQKGFGPRQSGFSYTSQKPFKSANCNILTCLRTVGQDS